MTLVLDRAGVTGPDGPSHHGLWDLGLLACVPGLRVACPRDATRLREQLRTAVQADGPTAVRFPRGAAGPDVDAVGSLNGLDVLHAPSAHLRRDLLMVAVGAMSRACVDAAAHLTEAGVGVTVVDPQWVWPADPALVELAGSHRMVVCVEDAITDAGIGIHLANHVTGIHPDARVRTLGLPAAFVAHASREQILAAHGLTGPAISAACLEMPAAR